MMGVALGSLEDPTIWHASTELLLLPVSQSDWTSWLVAPVEYLAQETELWVAFVAVSLIYICILVAIAYSLQLLGDIRYDRSLMMPSELRGQRRFPTI